MLGSVATSTLKKKKSLFSFAYSSQKKKKDDSFCFLKYFYNPFGRWIVQYSKLLLNIMSVAIAYIVMMLTKEKNEALTSAGHDNFSLCMFYFSCGRKFNYSYLNAVGFRLQPAKEISEPDRSKSPKNSCKPPEIISHNLVIVY